VRAAAAVLGGAAGAAGAGEVVLGIGAEDVQLLFGVGLCDYGGYWASQCDFGDLAGRW